MAIFEALKNLFRKKPNIEELIEHAHETSEQPNHSEKQVRDIKSLRLHGKYKQMSIGKQGARIVSVQIVGLNGEYLDLKYLATNTQNTQNICETRHLHASYFALVPIKKTEQNKPRWVQNIWLEEL